MGMLLSVSKTEVRDFPRSIMDDDLTNLMCLGCGCSFSLNKLKKQNKKKTCSFDTNFQEPMIFLVQ